jgi:predicted DNA-binding transcriptional regulator YafY
MIKELFYKFGCLFCRHYFIVYRNAEGKVKTYEIGNINLVNSFGNNRESRDNSGFRAYCFGRNQIRSFRHDRIISISKK